MKIQTLLFVLASLSCLGQTSIPFQTISVSGGGTSQGTNSIIIGSFGQAGLAHTPGTLQGGFIPSVNVFVNNDAPHFTTLTPPDSINGGGSFNIVIDDTDIDSVKIYHRKIGGTTFTPEVLTTQDGSTYSVTVQTAWMDEMGVEYYFRAVDKTSKVTRGPVSGYLQSYKIITDTHFPNVYVNGGTQKADYRIITMPDNVTDLSIGAVFSGLSATFDKTKYRIASYKGNNQWAEGNDLGSFQRGKGYWFLTNQSSTITLNDPKTPHYNQSDLFTLTLQPKWNQIGNPYTTPISWNDVIAYNSGITIKTLKVFNNGSYDDGDLLQAFQGGFVYLDETTAKQISIPFKGQTKTARLSTATSSNDLASDQWRLPLTLQYGSGKNTLGAIGMSPDALVDDDRYDDYNPPAFVDVPEIQFQHPKAKQYYFAKDVAPTSPQYQWTFTVASAADDVMLSWDNEHLGNNNIELYLLDEQNAHLIDMRENNNAAVSHQSTYKIYYGENIKEQIRPNDIAQGKPFPNPAQRQQTPVTIPVALPGVNDAYDIRFEIVDMRGQAVHQQFAQLRSGYHELKWNGEDHQNQSCSAGLYVYRVVVSGHASAVLAGKLMLKD